jgi:riboflavin synthase
VDLDFDVMAETLHRSVIGQLHPGDQVNLERAARVDGRLDGHIVQGHVDGTGVVLARIPGSGWESFRFRVPSHLARYVAEKGSIAVHGVSLTVTAVGSSDGSEYFEVGLIPETLRATNLGSRQVGDPVNLEVDVLAKYTERLLAARETNGGS